MDNDESKYIFSTPEGHNLTHRILQPQLPYDLHDAQLEGICKAIDGMDIMVLTPTGSGKMGYFTMYMLLMLSLAARPELVQPLIKKVPPSCGYCVSNKQDAGEWRYQEIGSIEDMGLVAWVWVFRGMPPDSIDQLMLCNKVQVLGEENKYSGCTQSFPLSNQALSGCYRAHSHPP